MKKQKGSVLVFALIILSFILLATFSLSSISMIERRSADITVNSSSAFQQADKGMEEFLQGIYKDLDPNNTLNDFADALNNMYGGGHDYDCQSSSGPNPPPVRMGNQNTEFIITAYTDEGDTGDDTVGESNDNKVTGGWGHTHAITDCDTQLADVARFRSTGNHNNAARAVFLRLKDSLRRGLVSHWSFEDRAQNARLTDEDDLKTSFMAGDSSRNNYNLTLCKLNTAGGDSSVKIKDGGVNENGDPIDVYVQSFDACEKATSKMNHKKQGNPSCDECNTNGSWVEGIVKEEVGVSNVGSGEGDAAFGTDAKEALHFSGNTYLTALVKDGECHGSPYDCSITANYVDNSSADKLNLTNGISISAWIKSTGTGTILSKWNNDKGYKLYVKSANEVCFELNDKKICKDNLSLDSWTNIIVTWRKENGDNDMKMYINTEKQGFAPNVSLTNGINVLSDVPLSIGAQLGDNYTASNYFTGDIDDVRIWDRALTEAEVQRLCIDAVGKKDNGSCDI